MLSPISSHAFDSQRTSIRSPPLPANGITVPAPQLLQGMRRGHLVDRAGDFLKSISSHSNCFPIFTSQYAKPGGELNSRGKALLARSKHAGITTGAFQPGRKEWEVDVDVSADHIEVRSEITDSIGDAIVYLIAINVPHALIIIRTPQGINYSVGYGFYGGVNPDETPKLSKAHSFAAKVLSEKASDSIKPLRGAIYTADYFTPDREHEARIIWVGILTQSIIDNINATLATAQLLALSGKYEDISSQHTCRGCGIKQVVPYRDVSCIDNDCKSTNMIRGKGDNIISILEMTLTVGNIYLKSAGFFPGNNYYNCFEWAKKILDIKYLNCGLSGNPLNCVTVTSGEINEIITAFETQSTSHQTDLQVIIKRIQDRLYQPGRIKQLSNCLGCFRGGKRRKINKKYTKRSRLHSRRRRSIKKKIK